MIVDDHSQWSLKGAAHRYERGHCYFYRRRPSRAASEGRCGRLRRSRDYTAEGQVDRIVRDCIQEVQSSVSIDLQVGPVHPKAISSQIPCRDASEIIEQKDGSWQLVYDGLVLRPDTSASKLPR